MKRASVSFRLRSAAGLLIGAVLLGGVFGLVTLFFLPFSIRSLAAGAAAGATFFVCWGLVLVGVPRRFPWWLDVAAAAPAGALAGWVWWMVSSAPVSPVGALVFGLATGPLACLAELAPTAARRGRAT
jgi:hypothetical protein